MSDNEKRLLGRALQILGAGTELPTRAEVAAFLHRRLRENTARESYEGYILAALVVLILDEGRYS